MLDGIMALWFALTALSVAFVALDIRNTPESAVLKWGFVLLTLYTGPIGAFLYVLGCREPLSGLHERYVAIRWRQVLGSTMHCVAGDGVGIVAGAVLGSWIHLRPPAEIALEYALGFGFGWTIFQALFMRKELGGSYASALKNTFVAELVSMNFLMAGMVPVMRLMQRHVTGPVEATEPAFWFVMSMALLAGFVIAYPVNWWLVTRHLKHGMMTVRPPLSPPLEAAPQGQPAGAHDAGTDDHGGAGRESHQKGPRPSSVQIAGMSLLSFLAFALALLLS